MQDFPRILQQAFDTMMTVRFQAIGIDVKYLFVGGLILCMLVAHCSKWEDFFLSQSSSNFSLPISWNNCASRVSQSCSTLSGLREKSVGNNDTTCFFHLVISSGWTLYRFAMTLIVSSPLIASMTAFALRSSLCCRRFMF